MASATDNVERALEAARRERDRARGVRDAAVRSLRDAVEELRRLGARGEKARDVVADAEKLASKFEADAEAFTEKAARAIAGISGGGE